MTNRRLGALGVVVGLILVCAGLTPAAAGSGTFGDNICSASKTNASGWGKTSKVSGSCGTLSVRLYLQANGGGPPYWTAWSHSLPRVSSFTKYAPNGSGLVGSDHGIRGLITVSYLAV